MGCFSWISKEGFAISHKNSASMIYKQDGEIKIAKEPSYGLYGEFGGIDYFDAMCHMNGLAVDRENGIDLYYNEVAKNVEYPQLYSFGVPKDLSTIDFTDKPEDDPNQGCGKGCDWDGEECDWDGEFDCDSTEEDEDEDN